MSAYAEMRDSVNLDQVIVTGTRTPKTLKNTPIQTRLISAQDIARLDATTVQDLLTQELPGVEFTYAMNQQTHLNFSGFGGQSILFLVDGDRLAGETMDDVDFTRLAMADIDHIEIIKGAASALYGSNAAGGVINLITKTPSEPFSLNVNGRYGTHHDSRYGFTMGLNGNKLRNMLSFTGTHVDTYDVSNGDKSKAQTWYMVDTYYGGKTYNVSDRLTWQPLSNLRLTLKGAYFFREKATASPTVPDHYRDLTFGARGLWDITSRDQLEVGYNFDQYDKAQHSTVTNLCLRSYSNVQNSVRMLYNHTLSGGHILTVGGDYLRDYLLNAKTANGAHTQHSLDAFVQYDWNISSQWELVAAMRYDHFSEGSQHEFTPKVNVRYSPHELFGENGGTLTLRSGYGMGFRTPTLKEQYYIFNMAGIWDIVGSNVVGTSLKSERSHNFNLSAEYYKDGYYITLGTYYNIIKNRITTGLPHDRSEFPGDPSVLGTTRWLPYTNIERYNSFSLDVTLQKRWATGLCVKMAYAYINENVNDNDNSGSRFTRKDNGTGTVSQYQPARPHSLTANIDWNRQLSTDFGINMTINGRFLSAVSNTEYVDYTTIDPTTGTLLSKTTHYDAYTLWRLMATLSYRDNIRLSLTVDNLFNYRPTYHYYNSPFTDGTTIATGVSIDI